MEQAIARGKRRLHMVPFKYPTEEKEEIIDVDPNIQGFMKHKLIFMDSSVDISHRVSNIVKSLASNLNLQFINCFFTQDRPIVVRETNGVLRRANREERYRINRIFFHREKQEVEMPKMFEEEKFNVINTNKFKSKINFFFTFRIF